MAKTVPPEKAFFVLGLLGKEDNIRGHRLDVTRVVASVCIGNCSQLEATLLVRDDQIHRSGE